MSESLRRRITSSPVVSGMESMVPPPGAAGDDEELAIAAMQHIQEKKIWPKHAWATEATAGSFRSTVIPPKTPWAHTSASADGYA